MRRYLYGWRCWFRALYLARTKKRGAGRQPWRLALRQAACDRWIVDGHMRGAKPPRFIRVVRIQSRHEASS